MTTATDTFTPNPYLVRETVREEQTPPTGNEARVLVVGAGFSGVAMSAMLKARGFHDFLIIDREADFGGCWLTNLYPGVACDLPSHIYSLGFRPNPDWSHAYSPGAEILEYLQDTANQEGLEQHFRGNTDMESARFDGSQWTVETNNGTYRCTFLVTATGHLVDPQVPNIEGVDTFTGEILHSAKWDDSVDLDGKRVAVIGTGASAIQVAPEVAKVASEVTVFQRTPAWIMPKNNREFTEAEKRTLRRSPEALRRERDSLFWDAEAGYAIMRQDPDMIKAATAEMDKHRSTVTDPATREALTPDYNVGCKRILFSDDFYPAMNLEHVTLEPSALASVDGNTLTSADGRSYEVDVIVFCTGFDVSEPLYARRVTGTDGRTLSEVWGDGGVPTLTMHEQGFPNLIALNARNTGLGHNTIIYVIESQSANAADLLTWAVNNNVATIDVTDAAQQEWNRQLKEITEGTVWVDGGGCGAWYLDRRTGTLTALWPGLSYDFRSRVEPFNPERFAVTYA